jgi:hypothetical protein
MAAVVEEDAPAVEPSVDEGAPMAVVEDEPAEEPAAEASDEAAEPQAASPTDDDEQQ